MIFRKENNLKPVLRPLPPFPPLCTVSTEKSPATGHAGANPAHSREEAFPFVPSALDFIQQETEENADRKKEDGQAVLILARPG